MTILGLSGTSDPSNRERSPHISPKREGQDFQARAEGQWHSSKWMRTVRKPPSFDHGNSLQFGLNVAHPAFCFGGAQRHDLFKHPWEEKLTVTTWTILICIHPFQVCPLRSNYKSEWNHSLIILYWCCITLSWFGRYQLLLAPNKAGLPWRLGSQPSKPNNYYAMPRLSFRGNTGGQCLWACTECILLP